MAIKKDNRPIEKVVPKPEQLIYVGPSLPNGTKQYEIFRGGIPFYLTDLYNSNANFRVLLVSVQDLHSSTKEISQFGTELNIAYKAMGRV